MVISTQERNPSCVDTSNGLCLAACEFDDNCRQYNSDYGCHQLHSVGYWKRLLPGAGIDESGMKEERAGRTPHRTYGGESPEQRIARRRSRFIETGRVLFSQTGYRKTTMRTLCAEAGLTDRYFYESFATIEDLLVAVYEELMQEMQGRIVTALQAAGPDRDAASLIDIGLDAFFRQVEDTAAARVIWLEVLGVSPRVDQVYNDGIRGFAEFILVLSRTMAPQWPVQDEIARVVAMGLIGAASEAAKDWLMRGYQQPREHLVQGVSFIFNGVLMAARRTEPAVS